MLRFFLLLTAASFAACRTAGPLPDLPRDRELAGARVRVETSQTGWAPLRDALTRDLAAAGLLVVGEGQDLEVTVDFFGAAAGVIKAEVSAGHDGAVVDRLSVTDSVACYGSWEDMNAGIARCFARHLALQLFQSPRVRQAVRATPAPAAASALGHLQLSGKLAVLDLRNFAKDLTPENVQYFTDVVRAASLKAEPRLEVITRENLLVLLQASGKKLEECEGACEVDTGRRIGADTIVSGEIQKLGSRYKLSLRLHDTREGRLLSSAIASGASIDELDSAAQKAAADLFIAP